MWTACTSRVAALSRQRRGVARQPGGGSPVDAGQHGLGSMGGRGLPVRRDGGQAARPEAKIHIHRKGKRGTPLTEQAGRANRTKSASRAIGRVRVEHVFGAQANDRGGTLVRTIGLVRARARIGMKTLVYNMRRLCQLRRINPCPA